MAGHSKWANIRYRKSLQDAKRGKLFTKFIREITISARIQGPDPNANPRLRSAIDKALQANMTRDAVERAIARGAGQGDGQSLEEIRFEGYGPGGVAVVVDTATDNRKRTVSEVRHAFSKHAGNLGTDGSVMYLFQALGQIYYPAPLPETLVEFALEADVLDIIELEDEGLELRTNPQDFHAFCQASQTRGFPFERADLILLPSVSVFLEGETAQACLNLIEHLEGLDDVQTVHSNADWSEEFLQNL